MHHGQCAPFLGWLLCPGQSTDAQRFQQNVCILKMARIVGNMHHTHCYRGLLKNGKLGVQMQRKTGACCMCQNLTLLKQTKPNLIKPTHVRQFLMWYGTGCVRNISLYANIHVTKYPYNIIRILHISSLYFTYTTQNLLSISFLTLHISVLSLTIHLYKDLIIVYLSYRFVMYSLH